MIKALMIIVMLLAPVVALGSSLDQPAPASATEDNAVWTSMTSGTTNELRGVWGSSSSDIFVVGQEPSSYGIVGYAPENIGVILHYDGSAWNSMSRPYANELHAVWGSGPSDVFAVGGGEYFGGHTWSSYNRRILHYDGGAWSTMMDNTHFINHAWGPSESGSPISESGTLYGVWGSSSTDVFAVGDGGAIVHYDGSSWSTMNSSVATSIAAVWGTSSSDVFAVVADGIILHYDGSSWSAMPSGTSEVLSGVWGNSSSDVFAVGDPIMHYDGKSWSAMDSGTLGGFYDVWGSSGADVFAVSGNGSIMHYDGSTWSAMNSDTGNRLSSIWGSSSSDVFVVGGNGTVLHCEGFVGNGKGGLFSCTCGQTSGSTPPDELLIGWAMIVLSAAVAYWVTTRVAGRKRQPTGA